MTRSKAKKVRDGILHVRCHQHMLERLKIVAERNHRTISGESIHAIEEYLNVEEARLGLTAPPPAAADRQRLPDNIA
jgi:hypothetical protein